MDERPPREREISMPEYEYWQSFVLVVIGVSTKVETLAPKKCELLDSTQLP
jgi:hypothetical protein